MFLEALNKWFVQLSSKITFSAKSSNISENLSLHCKNSFISLERNIFHVLSFALKIAFSYFFSLRKEAFEHLVASHSHIICTNTEFVFLEVSKTSDFVQLSSKITFSAKKLKLMKICLLHCKEQFISLERNIFHVVELCS